MQKLVWILLLLPLFSKVQNVEGQFKGELNLPVNKEQAKYIEELVG